MNNTLKHSNPRAISLFGREVDDFFNQVVSAFDARSAEGRVVGSFQPRADLAETEAAFELTLELPGVSLDQIQVEYHDGVLSVSGERTVEKETEGKKFHSVERRYGSFVRKFRLNEVDSDRMEASFNDGLLVVTCPKLEAAKPRKIEIKAK